MANYIKVYKDGSDEYKKLQRAATRLTELSPNKFKYYVGETYFDYGNGFKWTTVLCDNGGQWGRYQALSPVDQKAIILAMGDEQIDEIVRIVLSDPWCPDRLK